MRNHETHLELDDEPMYAEALAELGAGKPRPGLWAKAFAESDGDENKSRALYIKLRVQVEKQRRQQEVEAAKAQAAAAAERQAREFQAVIEQLRLKGYEAKRAGTAWTVREPLGGRVRLASDQELRDYAQGRITQTAAEIVEKLRLCGPVGEEARSVDASQQEPMLNTSNTGGASFDATPHAAPSSSPATAYEPAGTRVSVRSEPSEHEQRPSQQMGALASLNRKQRRLLFATAVVLISTLLFPPFDLYRTSSGVVRGMEFRFVFNPPYLGSVNVGFLLAEWGVILLVAGVAFVLLSGSTDAPRQATAPGKAKTVIAWIIGILVMLFLYMLILGFGKEAGRIGREIGSGELGRGTTIESATTATPKPWERDWSSRAPAGRSIWEEFDAKERSTAAPVWVDLDAKERSSAAPVPSQTPPAVVDWSQFTPVKPEQR